MMIGSGLQAVSNHVRVISVGALVLRKRFPKLFDCFTGIPLCIFSGPDCPVDYVITTFELSSQDCVLHGLLADGVFVPLVSLLELAGSLVE